MTQNKGYAHLKDSHDIKIVVIMWTKQEAFGHEKARSKSTWP